MLWTTLLLLLLILAIVGEIFWFKFQGSKEGKDERGKDLSNTTNSFKYAILQIGVAVLFLLELLDVITAEQFVQFLLYFFVSVSVFGSAFLYTLKKV